MGTVIALASGLGVALTGLIAVIWLAKKLVTAHNNERDALLARIDLTKRVDDMTHAVEDRSRALVEVQDDLRGEQQARLLAEKHRTELMATLSKIAPTHILVAGINDELRLLQKMSSPAPAPGGDRAEALHGAPPPLPIPELPEVSEDATTVTLTRDQIAGLYLVIGELRKYLDTQLSRCAEGDHAANP